jgi:hypothetical protein
MGGSTPALAARVAGLARYMGASLSEDEMMIEFRRYWWDSALSGSYVTTCGAEGWGVGDRVLWGSDFPGEQKDPAATQARVADKVVAVSMDTIRWFDGQLEKVYQTNAPQLENIRRKNILALFQARNIKLLASVA